ncbi:unnamed protein product [Symbiodinium sp. CCMP2592]|nr:unnamed protein product [Symbiodinium sp. CCMP2592]
MTTSSHWLLCKPCSSYCGLASSALSRFAHSCNRRCFGSWMVEPTFSIHRRQTGQCFVCGKLLLWA